MIMDVGRYWIEEFGIDGWRLDVPYEIDDDSFWQEFRRAVKEADPQAYIVGEVWKPAQRWLQGDQFDAVMNYIFARAAMGFFGAGTLVPTSIPAVMIICPRCGAVPRQHRRDARSLRLGDRPGPAQHARQP